MFKQNFHIIVFLLGKGILIFFSFVLGNMEPSWGGGGGGGGGGHIKFDCGIGPNWPILG